jgi:drug/metabolite transporter (DMT)-like permease
MTDLHRLRQASRPQLLAAFAAVYIIWGSTYLAIRFAIETLPPHTMAGVRFLLAGALLYAWARWRGAPAPAPRHWWSATLVGAFLLLGGNGGVVWAEQRVPSGMAALLIATVPLWMVLLEWLRGGPRPSRRTLLGLVFGLVGVALLVRSRGLAAGQGVDPLGALVLVLGALSWAWGSLYSRQAPLPPSPLLATAMEMAMGGLLLLVFGLARGEMHAFQPQLVSLRSLLALAYLLVFGSLLGFTAYIWLLHHTTAARASTYAFVNPLVAVVLGWALAGEALTPRMLVAAGIIVSGVCIIVMSRRRVVPVPQLATHHGPPAVPVPIAAAEGPPGSATDAQRAAAP